METDGLNSIQYRIDKVDLLPLYAKYSLKFQRRQMDLNAARAGSSNSDKRNSTARRASSAEELNNNSIGDVNEATKKIFGFV
jgi:hypothetical protein